jgi:hypothetical protein
MLISASIWAAALSAGYALSNFVPSCFSASANDC